MQEYLEVGRIINTHGVKGELKVLPLTDDPERYEKLKQVYVDKGGVLEPYRVLGVKYFKDTVIVKLDGVEDMTAAEALKGLYLKIDRSNAVKLPKGAYFICDLIDCEVFREDGGRLGVLKDVFSTGSNDVYVVKGENDKEILIPALKSVVREISVEDRKIVVSLPEGLVEDEV